MHRRRIKTRREFRWKRALFVLAGIFLLAGCIAIFHQEEEPEAPPPSSITQNRTDDRMESKTPENAMEPVPEDIQEEEKKQHEPPDNQQDPPEQTADPGRREEQQVVTVTNMGEITVLVNKQRKLPPDYEPHDLVVPNIPFSFEGDHPKKKLRKEAAEALEALFAQAKKENIQLAGVSGYRSYATQEAIFQYNVKTQGEEQARRVSAVPGHSEHQTGLAMDVSSPSVNYALIEEFGETKEGKWLAENAHKFGFIIRYPQGKEHITGYAYEPWHLRYVGKDIAGEIAKKGLTLEEYFGTETMPVSGE